MRLRRWTGIRFVSRAPNRTGGWVPLRVAALTPEHVLWWQAEIQPVIDRDPTRADAKANLDLVRRLQTYEQKKKEEEPAEGGDQLGADEVVIDDGTDERKRPEVEEEVAGGAMEEAMEEVWMRQVQTTPAGFLAGKFAVQAQEREEGDR